MENMILDLSGVSCNHHHMHYIEITSMMIPNRIVIRDNRETKERDRCFSAWSGHSRCMAEGVARAMPPISEQPHRPLRNPF
jgi:hypothetical protein